MIQQPVIYNFSLFTDFDIYLFKEGHYFNAYEKLGSHIIDLNGTIGTYFAVWAPNAKQVSVMGDFNNWNKESHPLTARWDNSGIWEGFIPGIEKGTKYKYYIVSRYGYLLEKGDPYAFFWETPPATASFVWDLEYKWNDEAWMKNRAKNNNLNSPISIYEMHLGSWKRVPEEGNRFLTYREMALWLVEYLKEMGFSHVEFLPIMEHPFYGSWGYQTIGYFAPTSRYGTPQDFMYLIDQLHQNGIGVILDWVPSHFPDDGHGLSFFDGTYLYEHQDRKKGYHPHWHSYIFNYGRNEVRNFLISSAIFWLEKYHVDALRVDAVASMLYLDYGRNEGEWIPNKYGGKENLEAIGFIKQMNETIYERYPDTQTIAEESTAWPMVSKPVYLGGLGFGMKWNMGWMHDTLEYFSKDPIYRKYHHNKLTFSIWYAFSENFILSLSHDEVVYGKGSLLTKMSGDDWQKFANLRLLYGYMYAHPGKKLLFMGGEIAQRDEWYHEKSLDWHLLEYESHRAIQRWVKDLNNIYRNELALHELDCEPSGFEWIDFNDSIHSVISFLRKGKNSKNIILVVCNFTPVPRFNYILGVPENGYWKEILNSDSEVYGGSNHGNIGGVETSMTPSHGRPYSISVTVPPLGLIFFKWMA
ncbi:1,4-alpha-glucan branching protein GlgB [Thermodesulfovibrio thiophilus]|uniref:1,4-alpha-glucan branching protein GlgB n=1 Tax=Thermodesulfovibrio thiophilus TaxID=340095 RepID=UPI0017B6A559|nr:1,4-alpha-glucan branching protein GlgB [Thermodesulfovibrio thiophilus]HHW19652.1 1,4-alpha-glucan branching protein GlgB [Thermodesulfovibrio thiophilus]